MAGLGAIGREVARRAQALGMKVVAWSRSLDDARAKALGRGAGAGPGSRWPGGSDVLSLHLPLSPGDARGRLAARCSRRSAPGAMLLNTARAELVDQAALLELARAGRHPGGHRRLRRASRRRVRPTSTASWRSCPTSTAPTTSAPRPRRPRTPSPARRSASSRRFLRDGRVPNCVNVARKTPARARLVVRHLDKVGVLANVLGLIREAGINVEEVQNTVFEEARRRLAAPSSSTSGRRPELLERIRARKDEVLFVDLVDL